MNDRTTIFDKNIPIQIPNIEKLTERGVFFSKAYCSSSACNPSLALVMTGTRPNIVKLMLFILTLQVPSTQKGLSLQKILTASEDPVSIFKP